MRQMQGRWRIGFRERAADAWWGLRGGSSEGPRRAILGRVLGVALVVIVAFDAVLLARALRVEPVPAVPAGDLLADTVSSADQDPFVDSADPANDPALVLPADPTQGDAEDEETKDRAKDRSHERDGGASEAATGSGSTATGDDTTGTGSAGDTGGDTGGTGTDTGGTDGTGTDTGGTDGTGTDTGGTDGTGTDTGPGGSGPGGGGGGTGDPGDTGGGGGGGGG